MARLSVTLDEALVEEARVLAQVRSKREAIELALQEFVQRHSLARLAELIGSDIVDWDTEELLQWRDAAIPQPLQ